MKCGYCKVEYSDAVVELHMARCLDNPANAPIEPEEEKPLEKRSVAELKAYAEQNKIDLGEAAKKEDILAAILKHVQGGDNQGGGAGDQQNGNPDADKA